MISSAIPLAATCRQRLAQATLITGLLLPAVAQAAESPLVQWLGTSATIPNWQLLVLGLLALAAPAWLTVILYRRLGPAWRRYREDDFLGMRWRWNYKGGEPQEIRCYCPEDDTQLTYHYSQTDNEVHFRCETCERIYGSFAGDVSYVRGVIRRQVQRKLRTGEWQMPAANGASVGEQ